MSKKSKTRMACHRVHTTSYQKKSYLSQQTRTVRRSTTRRSRLKMDKSKSQLTKMNKN